jgi:tetratricopeptide (TPR) repeat protein
MIASIVEEVVCRLKPQESSSQRILRVPEFAMAPVAAKWVRRGIKAAAEDDWLEAERLFLQAMREAPDECTVNGNLGVAYEKNGRLLEAVAAYERAYRCRPKDPTYRYYSDDLQTAFVPDLQLEDLPTIVLGVRGDGILYLSAGENSDRRAGQQFAVYRTEVVRDLKGSQIKRFKEIEIAQGRIVEVDEGVALGQLLLYNPKLEVCRGDLVRLRGN